MVDAIYAVILAMVGFAVVTLVGIGLMWAGFALVHGGRRG